ncbi:energy-coupling factor transporter transmembrane component T [Rhizobium sp. EC-SD404]|uniref:energy-coupling factor transporter transmembrane component T family protein n=1 Tax=Rhizobium sp. EC-SD404 TaxID=2038389 RepID=UPI001257026C|nr:energy-coupling factor transporter transmembrane component T [Rhizobium sp. EC-SD404]VVT10549.1 Energy-coupling factor transport system permease protein [Rhizobium sp. EC-SD404]
MLRTVHPLPKLVVALIWLAASIFMFDAPFQIAVILTCVTILIALERLSPLLVLALIVPFALFGAGFITTSVLFRQESEFAVQMAKETPFGDGRLQAGIVLFLRAIACGMVSAVFVLTTNPGSFVKALMVNWRLSPRIGYALFAALQLVPDLAAELQQMRLARAMRRGAPPRRIPGPLEVGSLVVPLIAYAIRRAGDTALAMESRGLGASPRRTVIGAPVSSKRDAIFCFTGLAWLLSLYWMTLRMPL